MHTHTHTDEYFIITFQSIAAHCSEDLVCKREGFLGKDCKCWYPGNPVSVKAPEDTEEVTQGILIFVVFHFSH